MKKSYVDTQDGQIHYGIEGSGEPMLLLHQNPRSMDEWNQVIPILTRTKKVIAIDIPGYGNSYTPPRDYTVNDYAKAVVSLMDSLGIKRASLVGHHTGAYISCEVAAAYPERVDKIVLSGIRTFIVESMRERLGSYSKPDVKEDGSHLIEIWDRFIKQYGAPPKIANRYFQDIMRVRTFAGKALSKYRVEERLPLIKCPTLFIYGAKGLIGFPIEDKRKADQAVSRSKVSIVEEGRNYILDEMPDKFAKLVLDFLDNFI